MHLIQHDDVSPKGYRPVEEELGTRKASDRSSVGRSINNRKVLVTIPTTIYPDWGFSRVFLQPHQANGGMVPRSWSWTTFQYLSTLSRPEIPKGHKKKINSNFCTTQIVVIAYRNKVVKTNFVTVIRLNYIA